MDIRKAIRDRRSIRSYRADDIPEDVIREILDEARWAPSWGNTQPWEFYVLTGQGLERFKKENRQSIIDGEFPAPEITMPSAWPETHSRRYKDVGERILTSMSIARADKESRKRYYNDMFALFDAPCVIVICVDKSLSIEYAMLDIGLISQTICLLAHERGIGSCIMAAIVSFPKLLRKILPIPEDKVIVIGMVLGYPDEDSPVNGFERARASLDEIITWVR
jgi:nitroreductase